MKFRTISIAVMLAACIGCATPRDALLARERLTASMEQTANEGAAETDSLVQFALSIRTEQELAKLKASYDEALSRASEKMDTDRDIYVARISAAYILGQEATLASARAEGERLSQTPAKFRSLGRAARALNDMADSEAALATTAVQEFTAAGGTGALDAIIQQLREEQTPAALRGIAPPRLQWEVRNP